MIKLVFGLLIALLLPMTICVYYSEKDLNRASGVKEKVKHIFTRTNKEYIVLGTTFLATAATFVIGQYVYHQTDIFLTYSCNIR